ncbi:branched-chain amino acid ABC transporter [Longispora fulva]|uniref:Branched-chain amino acid transport system substrate-binding protein n=1 Tax=Longispora fulva TaxID=619741 RepID=A0A8J7GJ81_9ACTN|nr:ABC transporter substrate-binding protein [Longispora fulva]MBG6140304.1 branched-chain amino acid transport system substrate-binding protein [Longispora fulva]GIG57316.1 branched-chain amino acid ABC transporter [Longispora fulva]
MRKPRILVALLSLAVVAGMAGCAAEDKKAPAGEIKIGASLELSGATASIGTTYEKALKLKVDQINKAGGVNGRKINLVIRDNRTDPAEGLKNVNYFIDNEKVAAIIGGGCSNCIIPAKPVAAAKKVPIIALGAASGITNPIAESKFVFKISPNPVEDATVIVNELQRKGVTKIGLISVKNVYGQDGKKNVTELAQAKGIQVVAAEEFNQDDKDMTVQVSKIVEKKPDAIVTWAVMPAAGLIAQALSTAKFSGGVYLDAGAGAELFVKGAQDAAENTFMVFPGILAINDAVATTPQVTAQKAWFKDYSTAYGNYSGFASFGADAVSMIAAAVTKTGSTDPEKLRDAFETIQLDGMTGPIKMTAENHSGLQADALKIVVVKNGEWRLAS